MSRTTISYRTIHSRSTTIDVASPGRHFTIRGADGTDFEGGIYHGRILVSTQLAESWTERYSRRYPIPVFILINISL